MWKRVKMLTTSCVLKPLTAYGEELVTGIAWPVLLVLLCVCVCVCVCVYACVEGWNGHKI